MANPTIDLTSTGSARSRGFNLPAWLVLICIVSFTVLLIAGAAIYKNAPPMPTTITSGQHEAILTAEEIQHGQTTYLGRGGQHVGSIWGHGSYLAPDWSADVLHRWGLATAGVIYQNDPHFTQAGLEALTPLERGGLQAQVQSEFKTNRYDPKTEELTLTTAQTLGLHQVFDDYHKLLTHGSRIHSIPDGWFTDDQQIHDVTAFFTWTAWAAVANRPNAPFSYTANWPHDDLVGNHPPGQFVIWSIVSVIVLIAMIALFLTVYITQEDADEVQVVAQRPAIRLATPSQKVASLFFGVAMALFLVQMIRRGSFAGYTLTAIHSVSGYGTP